MSERVWIRLKNAFWGGAGVGAILMLIAGCHAPGESGKSGLLQRIEGGMRSNPTAPSDIAADGDAAITAACAKQSYENARSGLIVSETGLHEDVFTLKGRMSSGITAFALDDALRLESMLQAETKAGHQSPEEQSCIRGFEEHLETLTDPMVDQEKVDKDFDSSAYDDATKRAQEQLKKERPPKPQPAPGRVP